MPPLIPSDPVNAYQEKPLLYVLRSFVLLPRKMSFYLPQSQGQNLESQILKISQNILTNGIIISAVSHSSRFRQFWSNPFHLSVLVPYAEKQLDIVVVPSTLILKPDQYRSYTSRRCFLERNLFPKPNLFYEKNFAVIGVLGIDYAKYNAVKSVIRTLTGDGNHSPRGGYSRFLSTIELVANNWRNPRNVVFKFNKVSRVEVASHKSIQQVTDKTLNPQGPIKIRPQNGESTAPLPPKVTKAVIIPDKSCSTSRDATPSQDLSTINDSVDQTFSTSDNAADSEGITQEAAQAATVDLSPQKSEDFTTPPSESTMSAPTSNTMLDTKASEVQTSPAVDAHLVVQQSRESDPREGQCHPDPARFPNLLKRTLSGTPPPGKRRKLNKHYSPRQRSSAIEAPTPRSGFSQSRIWKKSARSVKARVFRSKINCRRLDFNLHFHLKTPKEAPPGGFVSVSPTPPPSPSPSCFITTPNGAGDDVVDSNSNNPLSDNEGKNSEKPQFTEFRDAATQTVGPLNSEDQSTLVETPHAGPDKHGSAESNCIDPSGSGSREIHSRSQPTPSVVSPVRGHSIRHSDPLPFHIVRVEDKSVPIFEMSLKDLTARLLLTCQNKRSRNVRYKFLWRLEFHETQTSTGEQYYQLFFDGRLLFGIRLILLKGKFDHPTNKICAYGCIRKGTNQWIVGPVFISLFHDLILV